MGLGVERDFAIEDEDDDEYEDDGARTMMACYSEWVGGMVGG
jgi:hypothetical protein